MQSALTQQLTCKGQQLRFGQLQQILIAEIPENGFFVCSLCFF
jgi:hypothetical protein